MAGRVLIVEDSATEALRARLFLEREGFEVCLAADGKEGLAKAAEQQPDLIVLDAVMPRMSGYEVWEMLRVEPKTVSIPVVMITTAGIPEGATLGRDGFITKPYDPGHLVARVKEFARRNGHGERVEEKRAAAEISQGDDELHRLRRELEDAKRTRSEFLANMSHELRTPLYGIMGMTDLVLGTELASEQREYLDTAKTSANQLLTILSDMLEFAEADTGKLDLEEKDLDLRALLEKTIEMSKTVAQEKGIELRCHIAPNVPVEVTGDARRLRQILSNLLDNAVRFTEQGYIEVQVDLAGSRDGKAELQFAVIDTGVGVPKEQQELIFDAFQQADGSTTRQYGGTGLGLAMARQLVSLMGGRIWLESEAGKGSTFRFVVLLKRQPGAAKVQPVAEEELPQHLRILLAEDSPTNQLIAVANLKKAGHTVQVANNGRKALEAWGAGEFDLVLMDVAMPEMDGLEATRAIREQEKQRSGHTPIIAMTAFALKEYQEKCANAGMDGYVSKPVSPQELYRVIQPVLTRLKAQTQVAERVQEPPVVLADALEVVGEDLDLLKDVVEMSLQECPEQMVALRTAVEQGDAKAVERTAHRLKGIMGNVGGRGARELAQHLETMGECGDLKQSRSVFQAFEAEMARVSGYYAQPNWQQAVAIEEGGG